LGKYPEIVLLVPGHGLSYPSAHPDSATGGQFSDGLFVCKERDTCFEREHRTTETHPSPPGPTLKCESHLNRRNILVVSKITFFPSLKYTKEALIKNILSNLRILGRRFIGKFGLYETFLGSSSNCRKYHC